jgi:hypothetical protein
MVLILKQVFDDCRIEEIMGEPSLLDSSLLTWVDRFVDTIQYDITLLFDYNKQNPCYIRINQFIKTMSDYSKYLKENTRPTWGMFGFLVPLHRSENDNIKWQIAFKKTTDYYRQRINSLYNEICNNQEFPFTKLETFGCQ